MIIKKIIKKIILKITPFRVIMQKAGIGATVLFFCLLFICIFFPESKRIFNLVFWWGGFILMTILTATGVKNRDIKDINGFGYWSIHDVFIKFSCYFLFFSCFTVLFLYFAEFLNSTGLGQLVNLSFLSYIEEQEEKKIIVGLYILASFIFLGWFLAFFIGVHTRKIYSKLYKLSGIYFNIQRIKNVYYPFVKRIIFTHKALVLIILFFFIIQFQLQAITTKNNYILSRIIYRIGGVEKLQCIPSESIKRVQRATVMVIGGRSEGSGFFIEPNKIITNFHVVEFDAHPKIIFTDKTFSTGEVVLADKEADIAIIKVNRYIRPLILNENVQLNQAIPLIAIGFPHGGWLSTDSSVIHGFLSSDEKSDGVIQIDRELISGMSGGPMITECGEVIGINSFSSGNLGFAISSGFANFILSELEENKLSGLEDIKEIELYPNESPVETVRTFYHNIKNRNFKDAFVLMSDHLKSGQPSFFLWKRGYDSQLDTTIASIKQSENDKEVVEVALATKDLVHGEIVYSFFIGRWRVKEIDGKLLLWSSFIQEVDPETEEPIE